MNEIEKGTIKIPQFQRDFVWSKEKSASLLDSIVKGYPVGTFILWKTKEELRSIRNIGGLSLPPTPHGDYIEYVLDGQQRLTSLFACLKGLRIPREDHEDDFSQFFLDLEADERESIVLTELSESDSHIRIRLHDLMEGKITELAKYAEPMQQKIQIYRDRINSYQFSTITIREAPIDVATEIFTRINVSGKPLSLFQIMVAKTFSSTVNFDLAEKCSELLSELNEVDYGIIPESVILQTISTLLVKNCRKKDILTLQREDIIKAWPAAADAIRCTVDFFRNTYRIPVAKLLPYTTLIIPFAYYFHVSNGTKPADDTARWLQDYFWRASLGGRYSQAVETRLAQDIEKIDEIISGRLPMYEWAVDTSADFISKNGWFTVGRAYIKGLLCILAYHEPKSFSDNSIVRISNDWLKQSNSRNYHHFFPKSYLEKEGWSIDRANHIANITIVDDFLNKRQIGGKPPSQYIKEFREHNDDIERCLSTHLIKLESFGVLEDDFDKFLIERCKALSGELKRRILEQDVDSQKAAVPAIDTDTPDEEQEGTI